jgi:hypothetical protein
MQQNLSEEEEQIIVRKERRKTLEKKFLDKNKKNTEKGGIL